ncbi:SART-1 family protein DOT2 [Camellia lanceoleosa]|uniref:SART-1 family protein DOT2 n=1 Tax=Camellia lanceoleosa TaxID=1840588 RepID=A0ACC0IAL8_9ERIC|nr:SART-1 family protein DOT2 [Camellia lanceoleosa]
MSDKEKSKSDQREEKDHRSREKGQRLVMSQKTEREQVKIWRKIEQQLKMGEVEMIKTRIGPKIKEGREIMIGISTKIKSVIKIKIKIVRIEGRKETVIEKPRQQRRIMSEQGRRRGQKRRAKIGIKKEIGQKTRKGKRRDKNKDRDREREIDNDRDRDVLETEKGKERIREERESGQDKERSRERDKVGRKYRGEGHDRGKYATKDDTVKLDHEDGLDGDITTWGKGSHHEKDDIRSTKYQQSVEGGESRGSHASALELEERISKMKEERMRNKSEGVPEILAWVNKSRKLEERRSSKKEKALRLSKIFEEKDNINQGEIENEAAPQHIAQVDMLENVEIGEQKREMRLIVTQRRKRIYDDKFNDERVQKKILPKYDDPVVDEGITLDASGRFTGDAEKKLEGVFILVNVVVYEYDQNPASGETQENKVVFTEMEEFVWGLQLDEEAHKPDGEDVFMEEDVAPIASDQEMKDEDGGWTEVNDTDKEEPTAYEDKEEIVPDEMIHEAAVGKGLSGALKLLKERGSLKETVEWGGRNMDKKKSKLVGIYDTDRQKEIRIEKTDEFGRIVSTLFAKKQLLPF